MSINKIKIEKEYKEYIKTITKSPKEIVKEMTEEKAELIHLIMGLAGEVVEVLEANRGKYNQELFIEELGDCFFYLEGLNELIPHLVNIDVWYKYSVTETKIGNLSVDRLLEILTERVLLLIDPFKKYIFHNKPFNDDDVVIRIKLIDLILTALADKKGSSKNDVLSANMKKLKKRYPEGKYTDAQAKNRGDKK